MKLSPNFFNEFEYFITPSDIIQFIYCKRYTYYMKCLGIPQYEEKHYKVLKGRTIHQDKEIQNTGYLRKKLNVVNKKISVQLYSQVYKMHGVVDEVLELKDGTLAPLDYKLAVYNEVIYNTYKMQLILYALMIQEMYHKVVDKGYIVYTRSNNLIKEIKITIADKEKAKEILKEYISVLEGYYPSSTKSTKRCLDCCYKNICQ